jgi:hypothetical protein
MPARSKKHEADFSLLSLLGELLSVPVNFFGGLVVGLVAPVAAVAGIVGGIYLFTKKVPFFSQVTTDKDTGERSLTLKLMTASEAQAALKTRQAELQDAWARVKKELTEVARQADVVENH